MANEHAKCLKNLGLNISSVISSEGSKTVDNFMSSYNIEHKFHNLKDIFNNKDIWDAAIICCSEEFVFPYLDKIAKLDKPILVEKPITYDLQKLEKLIYYKNIIVGFNRRFYTNISYLKTELEKNNVDLVKICLPESSISGRLKNQGSLPDLVYSNSIHAFDILSYLFGNISWHSSVQSKTEKVLKSCSFLGSNKQNINFSLDLPFDYPDNFSITIYSDDSMYVLKPFEILKVYRGIDIQEPQDEITHRIYKPRLQSSIVAESNENLKTGLLEQDKSFVEFCNSETVDCRLASLVDAKAALSSIIKIENLIKT